jgi:hypothetical protein
MRLDPSRRYKIRYFGKLVAVRFHRVTQSANAQLLCFLLGRLGQCGDERAATFQQLPGPLAGLRVATLRVAAAGFPALAAATWLLAHDEKSMPADSPYSTARLGSHPIHPILVPIPIACFAGTLLTDLMCWESASMQWANFSAWQFSLWRRAGRQRSLCRQY